MSQSTKNHRLQQTSICTFREEKSTEYIFPGLSSDSFRRLLWLHQPSISTLSRSAPSSQVVVIQADCYQVSLRSNKMFDKTSLSLEAIETTFENKETLAEIEMFWLTLSVSCQKWTGFCLEIFGGVGNIWTEFQSSRILFQVRS